MESACNSHPKPSPSPLAGCSASAGSQQQRAKNEPSPPIPPKDTKTTTTTTTPLKQLIGKNSVTLNHSNSQTPQIHRQPPLIKCNSLFVVHLLATTQPPDPLTERALLQFAIRQRRGRPQPTTADNATTRPSNRARSIAIYNKTAPQPTTADNSRQ